MTQEPKYQETEEKKVAKSYIMNFYDTVIQLTSYKSSYKNFILSLERSQNQNKEEVKERVYSEEEYKHITDLVSFIRYYIDVSRTMYFTLAKASNKLTTTKEKEMTELLTSLDQKYIVDRALLEEYCMELHTFIATEIIQNFLQTKEDMLNSTY